jgi:hypothetical protein
MVTVSHGLFEVRLGDRTPIPESVFNGATRWLEVMVSGEPLAPRKPMVSVPYAVRTSSASRADTSEFVVSAQHAALADSAHVAARADTARYALNLLGNWVDKTSNYGTQQAATDGFVLVQGGGAGDVHIYTDSSNPPTTERASCSGGGYFVGSSIMSPVRKNDYWRVTANGFAIGYVFWIPLGR